MNDLVSTERFKESISDLAGVRLIDADQLKSAISTLAYENAACRDQLDYIKDTIIDQRSHELAYTDVTTSSFTVNSPTVSKTIQDAFNEMTSHKLLPAMCVNCGGRIDRDTLTCCYCGTFYR